MKETIVLVWVSILLVIAAVAVVVLIRLLHLERKKSIDVIKKNEALAQEVSVLSSLIRVFEEEKQNIKDNQEKSISRYKTIECEHSRLIEECNRIRAKFAQLEESFRQERDKVVVLEEEKKQLVNAMQIYTQTLINYEDKMDESKMVLLRACTAESSKYMAEEMEKVVNILTEALSGSL